MGDSWTNIDYKKIAKEWMKPLEKGETTGMVEIPANWDVSAVPPASILISSFKQETIFFPSFDKMTSLPAPTPPSTQYAG